MSKPDLEMAEAKAEREELAELRKTHEFLGKTNTYNFKRAEKAEAIAKELFEFVERTKKREGNHPGSMSFLLWHKYRVEFDTAEGGSDER